AAVADRHGKNAGHFRQEIIRSPEAAHTEYCFVGHVLSMLVPNIRNMHSNDKSSAANEAFERAVEHFLDRHESFAEKEIIIEFSNRLRDLFSSDETEDAYQHQQISLDTLLVEGIERHQLNASLFAIKHY